VSPERQVTQEVAAIRDAIQPFATLEALRASAIWAEIRPRVERILAVVRRYPAIAPPAPPADPGCVRAVHWNVEHGNWYEQVEGALLGRPELAGADLLLFNEIDLGMARAGNRDVTRDLARALGLHAVFAPLFIETTLGRDDDPRMAAGRENQESLFGLAVLSRWPISGVRLVELPSPEKIQFDLERMLGRHIGLVCGIERPGAPFVAVSAHLEVHRTRTRRTAQVRTLLAALRDERRPVILAGDFNSHTFDRGLWHAPLAGAAALLLTPGGILRRRLLHPDRGLHREFLFDELRLAGFEWERFVDHRPTLGVRFDRLDEVHALPRPLARAARGVLEWAERRGQLRLDWFAGRGWKDGRGETVQGLDGPGKASDHAPIVAEFR
jgi:endonuclease/exonuclease/phosphatase family metal-dependent hydrolase